jgi:hypothetical protein
MKKKMQEKPVCSLVRNPNHTGGYRLDGGKLKKINSLVLILF